MLFLVPPGVTDQLAALWLPHSVKNLFLPVIEGTTVDISSFYILRRKGVSLGDRVFPGFQIGFPWEIRCLLRLLWCFKLTPCPRSCRGAEISQQYWICLTTDLPSWAALPAAKWHLVLKSWWALENLVPWACAFHRGQGHPVRLTLSMVSRVFTGLYLSQLWHSNKRLEIMNASLYFCSTVPLFFSV